MRHDVFIAHPSERKDAARACAEALRARGLKPFVDEQTAVGAVWTEALRRTQEGCRASVVLWYPGLEPGPYLRDEVETALLRQRQFGHLVFPVWLGQRGERLPYGLSGFQAAVVDGDWGARRPRWAGSSKTRCTRASRRSPPWSSSSSGSARRTARPRRCRGG